MMLKLLRTRSSFYIPYMESSTTYKILKNARETSDKNQFSYFYLLNLRLSWQWWNAQFRTKDRNLCRILMTTHHLSHKSI